MASSNIARPIACWCQHPHDDHQPACVHCDCPGYRPGVSQVGDPRGSAQHWQLLPVAPGLCAACAVDHEPAQPHDQQSLHYQYAFYGEHGRWPTWADAMAHCDAPTQEAWRAALTAKGVSVDG